jgi:hypothetical protein
MQVESRRQVSQFLAAYWQVYRYVWVVTIILEGCNLFIFQPSPSLLCKRSLGGQFLVKCSRH